MNLKRLIFVLLAGFLAGCATTEYKPLPEPPTKVEVKKPEGIYHKVQKGQTLWRIAQAYNVAVEDIIAANNIPNAAAVEVGQLLLIPGAKQTKDMTVEHPTDVNKDEFSWPLRGKIISFYNDRHGEGINRGVDIEANDGDVVKASRDGQVVLADYMSGYNRTVMVDHGDGFTSVYAQNRRILVKLGDHVYKGDPLSEVGLVTNKCFLHFEIRRGKEATNPLYYLP
ncbi:MAG: LysM peptidoglycan-binding domain-containing M23 family metallopeptidase [Candidatus Omnitrophota bacterium]